MVGRLAHVLLVCVIVVFVGAENDRTERAVKRKARSPSSRILDFTTPMPWKNATVYYSFAENLIDANQTQSVLAVLHQLQNSTCLRFIPRNNEKNYTLFANGSGCASMVGMQGGRQTVFLTEACFTTSRISRLIMHLLGIHSELNRPDRDQFLDINWQNIRPGFLRGFLRYPETAYLVTDVAFDYESVSHFDGLKFAVDPTVWTVRDKKNPNKKIGNDHGFSFLDIKKINQIYC